MGEPLISVVIAVRNGSDTIDMQLAALARQTMTDPWELIVVDNGSDDDTVARVLAWRGDMPALRVLSGPAEPNMAACQNLGVAASRAKRVAFCDADDVVGDRWVSAMSRALSCHPHVTGPIDLLRLNSPGQVWGDHVESWLVEPLKDDSFLSYPLGANVGFRREVFDTLGGFDECLSLVGHPRDLSWRAQLSGHRLWFEESALIHRRQRRSLLAAARQHIRYGRTETRLAWRYEPFGRRPRSRWQAIRPWLALTVRLTWLLRNDRRMRWVEMVSFELGRALPLARGDRRLLRHRLDQLLADRDAHPSVLIEPG